MLRCTLIAAAFLAGCYSPSTPAGAYRCSAADNACPSGQHCTCGLCVNRDDQAACSFALDATMGGVAPSVGEHQPFAVTITALQADKKTPAAGFNDSVSLSFTLPDGTHWCDVKPSTVALSGGKATVMVSLNRETIPPQRPRVQARFAGNSGQSGPITVTAPPFVKDATATVAPVKPGAGFGWADAFVAEPSVVFDGSQFRMYFSGQAYMLGAKPSIGVATSSDGGRTFTAHADPVFQPANGKFYRETTRAPSVFNSAAGWSLAFAGSDMGGQNSPSVIGLANSIDGLNPFAIANGGMPMLKLADCAYCDAGLDFPQVIDDPAANVVDGGLGGKLMFFSASKKNNAVAIGRASSLDGVSFTPEPAPVLSGDIGGEAVLVGPHVLIDGSVFKMWYSFARLADFKLGATLCDTSIRIGYATSSDGFYWVRSPGNVSEPAIDASATGWDAGVIAFLTGTPIAADGKNPSAGIALYYTTLRKDSVGICSPNGIGRATRP